MPFLEVWNSKLPFMKVLISPWNFSRLTEVVRLIGGRLLTPSGSGLCYCCIISCCGVCVNFHCPEGNKEVTLWDHHWACCHGPLWPCGWALLFGRAWPRFFWRVHPLPPLLLRKFILVRGCGAAAEAIIPLLYHNSSPQQVQLNLEHYKHQTKS